MSELKIKEREIVIPGEVLAEGMDYLPGNHTYREENKIFSKVVGIASLSGRAIKITPLTGPYVPKERDKIIGRVVDIAMSGWRLETNTAYSAMLNIKDATTRYVRKGEDLSKILAIGDYAVVKITQVTSQNLIDLTMKEPGLHKLTGGRLMEINCQKVPRVIGKEGSMITLVKKYTGCDVTVGQNGLIWIRGTPETELLAVDTIKFIEANSHREGLTDKVEQFLKENSKVSFDQKEEAPTNKHKIEENNQQVNENEL